MKTRPRRVLRLAIVSAALGAATTVGVAWALGAGVGYESQVDSLWARGLSRFEFWVGHRQRAWGSERYTSTVMPRATQYEEDESGEALPPWAQLPTPKTLGNGSNDHYEVVDGRGWPMVALSFRFSGKGVGAATTGTVSGGVALPARSTGAWYDPRALPLTPVWKGLALDAAVWGVAWAGVIAAVGGARSCWRKKRGLCRACGYDLRGVVGVCPECGRGHAKSKDVGVKTTLNAQTK